LEIDLRFDLQLIALSLLLIEIFFRQKNKKNAADIRKIKDSLKEKIRKKFLEMGIFAASSVSNEPFKSTVWEELDKQTT
jgi:hypothetical protein